MRKPSTLLAAILAAFLACCAAAAETPRPYTSGSLERIAQARADKPFVLVMWSLDCAVCMKELDLLGQTLQSRPALDVVLVSTDEAASGVEVASVLEKKGLGQAEAWIFAGEDAQQLRYDVDPEWYGELPRTYFYDAAHRRRALSGALDKARLNAWAAGKG